MSFYVRNITVKKPNDIVVDNDCAVTGPTGLVESFPLLDYTTDTVQTGLDESLIYDTIGPTGLNESILSTIVPKTFSFTYGAGNSGASGINMNILSQNFCISTLGSSSTTGNNLLLYSYDGINWNESLTGGTDIYPSCVCWNGVIWVLGGQVGGINVLM